MEQERAALDPNYLTSWYPFLDDRTTAILCVETVRIRDRPSSTTSTTIPVTPGRSHLRSRRTWRPSRGCSAICRTERGDEEAQIARFSSALLVALEPTSESRV